MFFEFFSLESHKFQHLQLGKNKDLGCLMQANWDNLLHLNLSDTNFSNIYFIQNLPKIRNVNLANCPKLTTEGMCFFFLESIFQFNVL